MTAEAFFTSPIVIAAIMAVLVILAFVFLRPRQRVKLDDDNRPLRPHMTVRREDANRNVAPDVEVRDILRQPQPEDPGGHGPDGDDLLMLKGVGPKLALTLNDLGFTRFEQIAGLSDNEVERIDDQLGAFRGRLKRDRVIEQAGYLARGDVDGFEQRFGKL